MKNERGITLIALVITIIVLLILAAVTISGIVKRNNVIDNARNAREETARQREEEEKLADGKLISDDVEYDSIDDFMNGSAVQKDTFSDYDAEIKDVIEVHNWQRDGDTLICTCSECTGAKSSGKTLTIGQQLDYQEIGGNNSTTISAEKSGIAKARTDYNKGDNNASWVADYPDTQTILKDENTKWIVIGAKDCNKNGTYETLLITTQFPTTSKIRLYMEAGYNYWIKESDRIAEDLYGKGARGMTVGDVNSCLNYTATGGQYAQGRDNYTLNGFTTRLDQLENNLWKNIKRNGTLTPDPNEENTEENLGRYAVTGYVYRIDDTNASARAKKILLTYANDWDNGYWLSTRGVFAASDCAFFGPGRVFNSLVCSYSGLFLSQPGSNMIGGYADYAFRAVVELREEIPDIVEQPAENR